MSTSSSSSCDKMEDNKKKFMSLLQQLPRVCSPTICGTLSQPATSTRNTNSSSRRQEVFEWSLEQKAILSPANTDEWDTNMSTKINFTIQEQEAELFFSQKIIAPSPLVTPTTRTTTTRNHRKARNTSNLSGMFQTPTTTRQYNLTMHQEEDEDEELEDEEFHFDDGEEEEDEDDEDEDDIMIDDEDDDYDDDEDKYRHDDNYQEDDEDNLLFSPQPLRSSQEKMKVLSPHNFCSPVVDTLQSTPKTTGSLRRPRHNSNHYEDDAFL